jgi:transcription elongation GreA/GreB family factor
MDKAPLRDELLRKLEHERDTLAAAQKLTSEGVTHDDARVESDKDTRATEASYLARGQAKRVGELTEDVERVRAMKLRAFEAGSAIALGAIVALADDDGTPKGRVFLAPAGGGTALGDDIKVVTPRSPLGRALIGATAGDLVEVERGAATEELEVISVA